MRGRRFGGPAQLIAGPPWPRPQESLAASNRPSRAGRGRDKPLPAIGRADSDWPLASNFNSGLASNPYAKELFFHGSVYFVRIEFRRFAQPHGAP